MYPLLQVLVLDTQLSRNNEGERWKEENLQRGNWREEVET